jgi:hypothetical protein
MRLTKNGRVEPLTETPHTGVYCISGNDHLHLLRSRVWMDYAASTRSSPQTFWKDDYLVLHPYTGSTLLSFWVSIPSYHVLDRPYQMLDSL